MEPSVDPLGIAALGWVVVQPGPDERFLTVHPPRGRGSAELLVDLAEGTYDVYADSIEDPAARQELREALGSSLRPAAASGTDHRANVPGLRYEVIDLDPSLHVEVEIDEPGERFAGRRLLRIRDLATGDDLIDLWRTKFSGDARVLEDGTLRLELVENAHGWPTSWVVDVDPVARTFRIAATDCDDHAIRERLAGRLAMSLAERA